MGIFKACDVRGRYGQDLTVELAGQLGRAVGTELGGSAVVVGGDLRLSTAPLKRAIIEGLMAAGCRVVDVGVLPTPAFYFARDLLHIEGAVMVTGSHNPPDDNGFKICLGPHPITEEEIAALGRRVQSGDFVQGVGTYDRHNVVGPYQEHIQQAFPAGGRLSVVVDAGNGCYSSIAPGVLRRLRYGVTELFCEPDGRFPDRSPNPAVAENLRSLCALVTEVSADMGVAYDGDGDRAVFVDNRGRVVSSDVSIVLFARHLLRRAPGEVVFDVKCSSAVPEAIQQAGGNPVMEKSGHAFIRSTLLQRKAVLGGEVSGHFFFGELGRDDGLYATLLMLQLVAESGVDLATLIDGVPRYPITPDIRLPCASEDAERIVRELAQAFAGRPEVTVSTLDGVRIAWADGWALARPSVTEPLITLRFEGHDEERLRAIVAATLAESPDLQRLMATHSTATEGSASPSGQGAGSWQ